MEKSKYLGLIIKKNELPRLKTCWHPIALLQSFLGLVNYYQVFKQNMHDLRALPNEILKKKNPWDWIAECWEAFEKNK